MNFAVAELVVTLCTAIAALVVATATVVWFMAEQFKKTRAEFWKAISSLHNTVAATIDDHKKEDDRRFERLTDQVWSIAVKTAQRHGEPVPPRPI
jgi:hypothetical protein